MHTHPVRPALILCAMPLLLGAARVKSGQAKPVVDAAEIRPAPTAAWMGGT